MFIMTQVHVREFPTYFMFQGIVIEPLRKKVTIFSSATQYHYPFFDVRKYYNDIKYNVILI